MGIDGSSAGPSRRQVLAAGTMVAVAGAETAAAVAGPETAAAGSMTAAAGAGTAIAAADYGSGRLGPWQQLVRVISPAKHVKQVVKTDGVLMFGDSLGVQDGEALAARLSDRGGGALAVHNWNGRPTHAAVDALAEWARQYGLPRRILMATGSNDIFVPPDFGPQVDRALRIAGPKRAVTWVDIQVARTRYPMATRLADQRNSGWLNVQLTKAAKRHPNLRIVPWAEYLATRPARLNTHLRDGVHTTVPAGQNARNELIVQALTTP